MEQSKVFRNTKTPPEVRFGYISTENTWQGWQSVDQTVEDEIDFEIEEIRAILDEPNELFSG